MSNAMEKLIEQYIAVVRKIYGNHLRKIILYGSYVRGDFRKDSDIDIKPIAKCEAQFNRWLENYPFYTNIKAEGVVL